MPLKKKCNFIVLITTGIVLFFAAYSLGIYQEHHHLWPTPQFHAWRKEIADNALQYDGHGRLSSFPHKIELVCPQQDSHTAVLLVFGQSNSANNQGQRYTAIDNRVVNLYNGKCYKAQSPLLGATGEMGETWMLLGNKLVESGKFDTVIIVPAGIAKSSISQWAKGGNLNEVLTETLASTSASHFNITHILWHQGEQDFLIGTPKETYKDAFRSIVQTIRDVGVAAPIYISKASYEATDRDNHYAPWAKDNPVSEAQEELPDGKTILSGVDTDAIVPDIDRFDGTHFSGTGQQNTANNWLKILK